MRNIQNIVNNEFGDIEFWLIKWPHLNPEDAAKLATVANAKRLALIHFDAHIYRTVEDREFAEKQAKRYLAAIDDKRIEI